MSVRSRAAVADRPVSVGKGFGTGIPPAIQAAEARSQMTPASAFGPGEPIGPYDGFSRTPRTHDYVTGYNIATRPRVHEQVSFGTLKGLFGAYDVARICVRHRIASLRSLDFKLLAMEGHDGDVSREVAEGKRVLKRPDRKTLFKPWLAKYLRGVLTYDAGTLYRMRNRAGRAVGLSVLDGTLIAPLQDYWGNPPDSPAPAYVQYVNGLPWNWLTRDDLVYEPYDPRDDSLYGTAPLEDVLLNANTDIRFQLYFLQRFTEGNLPAAFASAPESWSPDQIEQFQELWDAFMLGDQSRKSQIRWLPPGSKFTWSNEKDFTDDFSLFLMRKTCSAYSVVPADLGFTEDVNRSSGESQADVQHRVGDLPMAHHVQDILTDFLQEDLQLPLQFAFDLGEEQDDRVDQANADDTYMKMGVIGPSEIREMRYGLTDAQPVPRFIYTERAGPIPIASLLAVAGDVDPADGLPEEGAELPHTVFGGTEGVLPNPPIKVMSLAEREFGPGAMPPAPPPQPKMTDADVTPELTSGTVAKEGEGAAPAGNVTAGITAETGIYGYDLEGRKGDEDGPVDLAQVAKEMQAFRRFAKARRKSGEWRDFAFDVVPAGEARRLNTEGRASVAKDGTPGLTSRSGMISLDIPEGLITPPPGGVASDDMHVTVVYLGPDVDDDAFAAACDRARQAATLVPGPLSGTVSGVGAFPPSGSSDGKVPAWAAVAIPGAEVLRNALADLSASEHKDWTPHCTLAYLDPGEPLPAPLEPVPVTFGYLSVHRGGQVERFPLGPAQGDEGTCPCGTPVVYDEMNGWQHADGSISHDDGESVSDKMASVAKAAVRPKGRAQVGEASAPAWPGWDLDIPATDYWGGRVAEALSAALTKAEAKRLAAAWLASPESRVQHDGKRPAVAGAAEWLELNGPDLGAALEPLMSGLLTDAMAIGVLSAQAVTGGVPVAKAKPKGGLNPAASWKPGNTLMSGGILGDAGLEGPDPGEAADAAAQLAAGTRTAAGRALAEGGQAGGSAAATGGNLFAAVTNAAAAAAAVMNLIAAGAAQAANHWYLKLAVQWVEWRTDGASACAACQANEGAGPVRLGESFPGGASSPPQHPNCRCVTLPAGWVNPPPGTPGSGEPDLEDEGGEEDEGGLGTGDLEDSDAGEAGDEGEVPGDAGTEDDAADDETGDETGDEGDAEDEEPETDPDFSPLEFADRFEAQDWMAEHTPDLPPEQAEAVDWYTGPGAYEANAPLRNGETLPADVAGQVANLDAAMSPLPADMILARMVDMDAFGGVTDLASLEGQVITDQAFMSTSLGPAIGDAGSEVQMHIAAPKGTPGVITGTLSGAPSQREIVLARGTSLAVNRAVQDAEGGWQVWLTVVSR